MGIRLLGYLVFFYKLKHINLLVYFPTWGRRVAQEAERVGR